MATTFKAATIIGTKPDPEGRSGRPRRLPSLGSSPQATSHTFVLLDQSGKVLWMVGTEAKERKEGRP